MGIQRYSIIYSSKTGNTKKLAEKIREVLPEENCDYFGTEGAKALSSDILYLLPDDIPVLPYGMPVQSPAG